MPNLVCIPGEAGRRRLFPRAHTLRQTELLRLREVKGPLRVTCISVTMTEPLTLPLTPTSADLFLSGCCFLHQRSFQKCSLVMLGLVCPRAALSSSGPCRGSCTANSEMAPEIKYFISNASIFSEWGACQGSPPPCFPPYKEVRR